MRRTLAAATLAMTVLVAACTAAYDPNTATIDELMIPGAADHLPDNAFVPRNVVTSSGRPNTDGTFTLYIQFDQQHPTRQIYNTLVKMYQRKGWRKNTVTIDGPAAPHHKWTGKQAGAEVSINVSTLEGINTPGGSAAIIIFKPPL